MNELSYLGVEFLGRGRRAPIRPFASCVSHKRAVLSARAPSPQLQAPLQGRWWRREHWRILEERAGHKPNTSSLQHLHASIQSQLQGGRPFSDCHLQIVADVGSLLALFRLSADALPGGRLPSSGRCGRRGARSLNTCARRRSNIAVRTDN